MQGAATVAPDRVPGMLPIPVTKTHIYGIAQPNRRLGMRTPEQANSFVWQLMGPSHGLLGLGKLTQELGQVVKWSSGRWPARNLIPPQEPHLELAGGDLDGEVTRGGPTLEGRYGEFYAVLHCTSTTP